MASESRIVHCTFRVVKGQEEALLALFRDHDRVLRELALVTDEPTRCDQGVDDQARPFFVKIFTWQSEAAVAAAHEHPEVANVWEKMEPLCEPRDGRPRMEFPHVVRVDI